MAEEQNISESLSSEDVTAAFEKAKSPAEVGRETFDRERAGIPDDPEVAPDEVPGLRASQVEKYGPMVEVAAEFETDPELLQEVKERLDEEGFQAKSHAEVAARMREVAQEIRREDVEADLAWSKAETTLAELRAGDFNDDATVVERLREVVSELDEDDRLEFLAEARELEPEMVDVVATSLLVRATWEQQEAQREIAAEDEARHAEFLESIREAFAEADSQFRSHEGTLNSEDPAFQEILSSLLTSPEGAAMLHEAGPGVAVREAYNAAREIRSREAAEAFGNALLEDDFRKSISGGLTNPSDVNPPQPGRVENVRGYSDPVLSEAAARSAIQESFFGGREAEIEQGLAALGTPAAQVKPDEKERFIASAHKWEQELRDRPSWNPRQPKHWTGQRFVRDRA